MATDSITVKLSMPIILSSGKPICSIDDLTRLNPSEITYVKKELSHRYNTLYRAWLDSIMDKDKANALKELCDQCERFLDLIKAGRACRKLTSSSVKDIYNKATHDQQIILLPLLTKKTTKDNYFLLNTLDELIDLPFEAKGFKEIVAHFSDSIISTQPHFMEELITLYEIQEYDQIPEKCRLLRDEHIAALNIARDVPEMRLKLEWLEAFDSNRPLFEDYILLQDSKLQKLFLEYVKRGLMYERVDGSIPDSISSFLTIPLNREIAYLAKRVSIIDKDKEFLFLIIHALDHSPTDGAIYQPSIIDQILNRLLNDPEIREGLKEMASLGINENKEKSFCNLIRLLLAITSSKYSVYYQEKANEIRDSIYQGDYGKIMAIYNDIKSKAGNVKVMDKCPNSSNNSTINDNN